MNDENKPNIIFYCIGGIAVIWLSLLVAPIINGGLVEIIKEFPNRINNPFSIEWCKNSFTTILIFLGLYACGIAMYETTKKKYRRGKEYGSAIWGNAHQINKKYKQFPNNQNKILTQNVSIGLKAQKHRRNLNILVCGR